ncbi:helical backbone metal receptor [Congregibacter brevis]|uniref:Helical backbone metal receptor n=1 Tax=Congregibacter brevis TaxID=3081201 RepID=A0ABZ0ICA6_9GAMM|nr:helical backbone metal receptor [Congregibacter sp. IMCC45268]
MSLKVLRTYPFALLFLCLTTHVPALATVVATDSDGRRVELIEPAKRVVALAPHIVENLYSIGAQGSIVGAVQYSDYPESAKSIPRLGGVGSISLENIVALEPDLIILWGSGTPTGLRANIERLGLPYFVDEIRSLEELSESLEALSVLTGHLAEGLVATKELEEDLSEIGGERSLSQGDAPGVFLQLWDQPLQSIGREHLLNEVIERCGAYSVTRGITGLAPLVSLEQVLAEDPAFIITESAAQAQHWSKYPQLRSVREGNIAVINPDFLHRPTLRLMEGMRQICKRLKSS